MTNSRLGDSMPGLSDGRVVLRRGRLRATFSTAEIAAFSKVTKAATHSQQLILHAVVPRKRHRQNAVVPRKRHRQNAEVATGWPRGGLAPAKVKIAARFEPSSNKLRKPIE